MPHLTVEQVAFDYEIVYLAGARMLGDGENRVTEGRTAATDGRPASTARAIFTNYGANDSVDFRRVQSRALGAWKIEPRFLGIF
ncbi:MAG: hypothetical protein IT427_11830 [Pirellulales bacterium]|nr:hypothetical protein [Pirellulales bacterium]